MLPAVVPRPGGRIGEPEAGPQVHDLHRGRELRGQRGGLRVRHRHEDKVGPGKHGRIRGAERPVREPDEVRVHGRDRGPGVRPGRQRADLQVRVPGQEAEQFSARVAARTCYCDPCAHVARSSCSGAGAPSVTSEPPHPLLKNNAVPRELMQGNLFWPPASGVPARPRQVACRLDPAKRRARPAPRQVTGPHRDGESFVCSGAFAATPVYAQVPPHTYRHALREDRRGR